MLYDIGFFIFSIFYLPALIFNGKLHRDFLERFGVYSEEKRKRLAAGKGRIWIEAVSVGEVALCKDFIPLLKKELPGKDIVISTITKTGNDLARKLFASDAVVIYFPLDISSIVKRVVGMIKPGLYIMIETEIWPNVIRALKRSSVPSIIINGRISDRSFGKYRLVRPFLKSVLNDIDMFCMQSRLDADRISEIGAPEGRIRVTGTMKFDAAFDGTGNAAEEMRSLLGLEEGNKLFVAGSIHGGEEQPVLDAFTGLVKEFPDYRLLIAPRHIERVEEVKAAVKRSGFDPVQVSDIKGRPTTNDGRRVLLLDTIGNLKAVYSAAAIVFIGGSLVRHGGQNPIEPAVFGKPVIFGPYMFNFRTIASLFLESGGAIQVRDGRGLAETVKRLAGDDAEMSRVGRNAKRAVDENRGASRRSIEAIKELVR